MQYLTSKNKFSAPLLIILAVLTFSLTGCGGDTSSAGTDTSSAGTDTGATIAGSGN